MTVVDARVKKGSLVLGGENFSCQPTNVTITPDHDDAAVEDSVEVLCGDVLTDTAAGVLTANLTFTSIQDFTNSAGLIAFSWANDGAETEFTWNPTSDAQDEWTGKCTPQALLVGGDVGARITADGEWKITQLTTPTRLGGKTVIGDITTVVITGVTAGTPGAFQPTGSNPPADLAALKADTTVGDAGTNKPSTAWTTGQWITTADTLHAYWDGTAWQSGDAV